MSTSRVNFAFFVISRRQTEFSLNFSVTYKKSFHLGFGAVQTTEPLPTKNDAATQLMNGKAKTNHITRPDRDFTINKSKIVR